MDDVFNTFVRSCADKGTSAAVFMVDDVPGPSTMKHGQGKARQALKSGEKYVVLNVF
jgi:hypothetical protein